MHRYRTPGLRREPGDRAFNRVRHTRSGESQNQAPWRLANQGRVGHSVNDRSFAHPRNHVFEDARCKPGGDLIRKPPRVNHVTYSYFIRLSTARVKFIRYEHENTHQVVATLVRLLDFLNGSAYFKV